MSKKSNPKVTTVSKADDFTRITFKPDLAKFGMTHLDDDTVALLKKRAYDLAGCVQGIKVFLNDVRIKIKNFKDYIDMYNTSPASSSDDLSAPAPSKPAIVYERVSDRWELAVMASQDGQFHQISFVNAICTSKVKRNRSSGEVFLLNSFFLEQLGWNSRYSYC